ncbi:MAG: hypothetical protein FWE08_03950 [Oscillospiraceae bacterium]|nr:hypothetical protein [Oscillospiraceae bacterium]
MREFRKKIWDNRVNIIIIALLLVLLLLSLCFNFRDFIESRNSLLLLKTNVLYIIRVISRSTPLIVFLLLIYIWRKIATKLVVRVEKLDVGGMSVIFERPEELFRQQIKNFLNTKRTLFYFDPTRDNIYDCINSCYKIYEFIRENMSVYDTKSSQKSEYYKTANGMLYELNEFLTNHQSDYKRWYKAMLEKMGSTCDDFKSITEIQKEYKEYAAVVEDFDNLNSAFLEYVKIFEVDTKKWEPRNN